MTESKRVAVITGGSRGIGRQVAERLAASGYDVVLGYAADDEAASAAVSSITGSGGSAIAVRGDVADDEAVGALFDEAEREFGGVDVVVNAAGVIVGFGPVAEASLDAFDRTMRTNVRGTYVVAQQAARRLRPGGALITFSSSATRYSRVGSASYAMSKGAVETLTLVLARELRGRDVTVNTIAPGVIATELFEDFLDGRPDQRAELIASSPMDRLGTPDDVAKTVEFLAGDGGRWVNGQVLFVNGGGV